MECWRGRGWVDGEGEREGEVDGVGGVVRGWEMGRGDGIGTGNGGVSVRGRGGEVVV